MLRWIRETMAARRAVKALQAWAWDIPQEMPVTALKVTTPVHPDNYKNGYGWAQFRASELLEQHGF